jgi:hypothetical protein
LLNPQQFFEELYMSKMKPGDGKKEKNEKRMFVSYGSGIFLREIF